MKAGFLDGKLSTKDVILNADELFHRIRWNGGSVVCPYCGEQHRIYQLGDKFVYKCGHCNHKFSDRTKTLLHGSKLSTQVWMQGIYEVFTDNFISSIRLAVKLHINQKSAWLLLSKLRYGLEQRDTILSGMVAQDEMYLGGCLSNYHYERKLRLLRENHYIRQDERKYTKTEIYALNSFLKQPVFGLNDGNKIVLYATPNPIKSTYIHSIVKKHVSGDSVTVSDESKLYNEWNEETGLKLYTNNHHNNQYRTKEGYTSNRIENTFSWYKRGFTGITHCKYHQLYLNEFVFRYNTKGVTHTEVFREAVRHTIGKTVTYKDIKSYNPFKAFKVKKKGLSLEDIKRILETGVVKSITENHRTYTMEDFR